MSNPFDALVDATFARLGSPRPQQDVIARLPGQTVESRRLIADQLAACSLLPCWCGEPLAEHDPNTRVCHSVDCPCGRFELPGREVAE